MIDPRPTQRVQPGKRSRWSIAASAAIVAFGLAAVGIVAVGGPALDNSSPTPHVRAPGAADATQQEIEELFGPPPNTAESHGSIEVAIQPRATSDTDATPILFAALDGSPLQIPSGRPTVVYFMSTTGCVSCEVGAGELQEVYAQDLGVDVIALEMIPGTPADWMTGYQQYLGLDYPVVEDPDGAVGIRYDIAALSMAIVIDATGHQTADLFDPADRSALERALATVGVVPKPASASDTQPPKLLP